MMDKLNQLPFFQQSESRFFLKTNWASLLLLLAWHSLQPSNVFPVGAAPGQVHEAAAAAAAASQRQADSIYGLSAVNEWRQMKCCGPALSTSAASSSISRWLQRTLLHIPRNLQSGLFVWIRGIYIHHVTATHFFMQLCERHDGIY